MKKKKNPFILFHLQFIISMCGINDLNTSSTLDVSRTSVESVSLSRLSEFCRFRFRSLIRSWSLRERRRRSCHVHFSSLKVVVDHLLRDELLLVVHTQISCRCDCCALLHREDGCSDECRDEEARKEKKEKKKVAGGFAPLVDIGLCEADDSVIDRRLCLCCGERNDIIDLDSALTAELSETVLDVLLEGFACGDIDVGPLLVRGELCTPDVVSDTLETMRDLEGGLVAGISCGSEDSEVRVTVGGVLEAIRSHKVLDNSLLTSCGGEVDLGVA